MTTNLAFDGKNICILIKFGKLAPPMSKIKKWNWLWIFDDLLQFHFTFKFTSQSQFLATQRFWKHLNTRTNDNDARKMINNKN